MFPTLSSAWLYPSMNHLIICREYPPAPQPPGGIGKYVQTIARLFAEEGEVVHVIGQLWEGAPQAVEIVQKGHLVIHRVQIEDPLPDGWSRVGLESQKLALRGLADSDFPAQVFSWQASLLAEMLIASEAIDLVEAQEWEAPLYYLLLRRALGLGPRRRPPCVVHLHSPSEFIFRHNGWSPALADYLPAKRLEEYTISAADALLCPSHYLAGQAEQHYRLRQGSIEVIPYPMGDTPRLRRGPEIWENGTICYVGRIELRKGVLEWVDAAVEVAAEQPDICFEFIGGDVPSGVIDHRSVGQMARERIPRPMKRRFRFRGSQPASTIRQLLACSRVAVVPSRWENLPYSCIEAMSTGLPVIASPEGGMKELLVDGESGWVAASQSSQALAAALRRALRTPAAIRADMGNEAALAVRRLCDNSAIVRRQLEWRTALTTQRAGPSLHLPAVLRVGRRGRADAGHTQPLTAEEKHFGHGIGIVVTSLSPAQLLDACLTSIASQESPPVRVVVVVFDRNRSYTEATEQARAMGCALIEAEDGSPASAKSTGLRTLLESGPAPLGVSFVTADLRLDPAFVAVCESLLLADSDLGICSAWTHRTGTIEGVGVAPCPCFPYQWLVNDAAEYSVVRTEALLESTHCLPELPPTFDTWDLFNAVLAAGWTAVTYPAILATEAGEQKRDRGRGPVADFSVHQATFSRFSRQLESQSVELISLARAVMSGSGSAQRRFSPCAFQAQRFRTSTLKWFLERPLEEKLRMVREGMRNPRMLLRFLMWRLRSHRGSAKGTRPESSLAMPAGCRVQKAGLRTDSGKSR